MQRPARGAEALDRASSGQLSFLEPGNALATALAGSGASAVLIPARGDGAEALQQQASLYTQCADTTVISARIDMLSTG